MNWLTKELKEKIRKVFEPRYKRKLTDEEIYEIAENLSGFVEAVLEMKAEKLQKTKNSEIKKR